MFENFSAIFTLFSVFDFASVGFFLAAWAGMGFVIERENPKRPSTHQLMRDYRMRWMEQMVKREPRIFDAQVLASLRHGANLFLSATMIAIGGCVAILGQAERLQGLASEISVELTAPLLVWEAKIFLVVLVLTNAFLRFVWSVRLFGYCAVVMAAVPNDSSDPKAFDVARRAGKLNIYAARSFNRGLRAIYFALTALLWLLGPAALVASVLVTVLILYRREFNSLSRSAILEDEA